MVETLVCIFIYLSLQLNWVTDRVCDLPMHWFSLALYIIMALDQMVLKYSPTFESDV